MRRKSSSILIVIAIILMVLNYDFSNEVGNKQFWLFIGSLAVLVVAILDLSFGKR